MDSVVRLTLSGVKKTVQLYTAHWLPWRLSSKETTCSAGDSGDLGLIPGSRRSPEEGNVNLLQYSCLENPMDRGAWQATVCEVARVRHDLAIKLLLLLGKVV